MYFVLKPGPNGFFKLGEVQANFILSNILLPGLTEIHDRLHLALWVLVGVA